EDRERDEEDGVPVLAGHQPFEPDREEEHARDLHDHNAPLNPRQVPNRLNLLLRGEPRGFPGLHQRWALRCGHLTAPPVHRAPAREREQERNPERATRPVWRRPPRAVPAAEARSSRARDRPWPRNRIWSPS